MLKHTYKHMNSFVSFNKETNYGCSNLVFKKMKW